MEISILENIGLNKSEIKVYVALLKLGSSTTGLIIKESRTADSKVYEVLQKLIDKGLVSYFTRGDVRYYKASNPNMILEYIKEKKNKIEDDEKKVIGIMPFLQQISKEKQQETEATIFSGTNGMKTGFRNLVDDLMKGEEVHIMGVYDFGEEVMPIARFFQNIRSKKGIKAKFLINSDAIKIAREFSKYPPLEIRYLPKGLFTPAIFLIYKDKVIINIAREKTMFVLKSKSTAAAFDAYFQMMWKTGKKDAI